MPKPLIRQDGNYSGATALSCLEIINEIVKNTISSSYLLSAAADNSLIFFGVPVATATFYETVNYWKKIKAGEI
jgi:hypothetical protein